jgi:ADP-heptose:LPS heptosyltransferase
VGSPAPGPAGSQLPPDRGNPLLKRLDRLIGIPALVLLGASRRLRGRRAVPEDWQTIGLLKTAAIGDVILLSGVIRDLRAAHPSARIVLFVTATNAGFARLLDGPDDVIVLPVRAVPRAVREVRAEHVDVFVDFGSWPRFDALVSVLSGAHCTIGRRTRAQHRHYAYDIVVDHASDRHELDNFRALVAPLGVHSTSDPTIPAPTGPPPLPADYAVLHRWPGGANCAERSWPDDHWRALAEALTARSLDVVLTGGPGDVAATDDIVRDWDAEGSRAHAAAGGTPADCARWLSHSAGVVSVNTGVMHLAAALDVPTIGLSGPTSCRRWGPIGPRARCVPSPVIPGGYLDLGFERDDRYPDCMDAITVDAVLEEWDALVSGERHAPQPRREPDSA